ncbi:VIT family protein [Rhodococcus sp. KBS0724]|jgi:VIT1/CCC1 family predicted Fe2+/Mn2+ transporter|uniref:VIT1/CCC1 transporter family protein n=1 Tax=Rhodococcus sp. KBS0724 TaxID=1179674 RepID=UPI00110ED9E3|nr:VIT family protein [Rhodococcus sp. KBS0724]TSD45661.1 VIT family protein [Rhodococcus sp. KBS0724]
MSDSVQVAGEVPSDGSEPQIPSLNNRLNWLRAGVLGANDGIVSTAGLVIGVAAATTERSAIFTAGFAGLVAGAVSMALGEYVSVSAQRDTERALLKKEKQELQEMPEQEFAELVSNYEAKGLSTETATKVAEELTEHDAFAAHVEVELKIDPNDLTNPWHAAISSAVSFTIGAAIPLIAILLPSTGTRVPIAFFAVLVALALTGTISATLGGARKTRAILRVVLGGALAMAVTYGVGQLVGTGLD